MLSHEIIFFQLSIGWSSFFGGLLTGFALFLLFYEFRGKLRDSGNVIRERQALVRRLQSEAILKDLDLGILAYDIGGRLLLCNETAERFLGSKEHLQTITDFLELFPNQTGITSAVFLEAGGDEDERNVLVRLNDRAYRLRLSDSLDENGEKVATLIRLQDVSALERQDLQRKEFVANVSHELKTPLTTIKSYSESLLTWGLEEKDEKGIRRDIQRIYDDVLRMEQLVSDLLLLSTLDNKAPRAPMEEADALSLARRAVESFRMQAEEKEIDLNLVVLSRVPTLFCDRDAVGRILNNLIANAIKYTDKKGKVTVYLSSVLDEVNFKVADTGLGVPPEHLPHLFERFYRVDTTGSRRYGGTGLGLSIAKELTELHEGKLLLSSVLGQGTEFTLVLPSAGKVYRQCLRMAREQTDKKSTPLYESAAHELLLQARDFGFKVERLEDLSLDEASQLMSQYDTIPAVPSESVHANDETVDSSTPEVETLVHDEAADPPASDDAT